MTGTSAGRAIATARDRGGARRRVAAVAIAASAVLVSACSGGDSPDGAAPSSSTSSTSSAATPSISPTPLSTAEREATDRAAVEQAWVAYWRVHQGLLDLQASQWPSAVGAIAVDPTRQQVLDEAATFAKSGLRFYGQVVNHPYWQAPINGRAVAVMGDCMDSSRYGTLVAKTGVKRTVGVAKNNTRATLTKADDGTWRVQKIEYLVDTPC